MQYLRWVAVADRLPLEEFRKYCDKYHFNPEFIVYIDYASVPTALSFDGTGFYWDGCEEDDRDYYEVTHWMMMPPKPEDCLAVADDFGEFKPEYEALELLYFR